MSDSSGERQGQSDDGRAQHLHYHWHIGSIDINARMQGHAPARADAESIGSRDDSREQGGGGGGQNERDSGDNDKKGDDQNAADKQNKEKKSGDAKSNDKGDGKDDKDQQKPRSKLPMIILGVVVVIGIIVALVYWLAHRDQVSTDDAYTDGNAITMAPKVAGYVVELRVGDNTHVHKGDLLVRIEPSDYQASLQQSQASLDEARAEVTQAEVNYQIAKVQYPAQLAAAKAQQAAAEVALNQARAAYKRQHDVDPRATSQQNIDTADSQAASSRSNVENAKSQLKVAELVSEQLHQAQATVEQKRSAAAQAEAQLNQSKLNVGYTEIRAPVDGFITMRNVDVGTYLAAGTTMFMIVTPDVWVTANFKETQLGRMRPGDHVEIKIDAYSDLRLEGHVDSIQQGSGSKFSAFPAENATGNYVKIVQRVPVKIVIDRGLDPNAPLPLGLSVDPVVHFR